MDYVIRQLTCQDEPILWEMLYYGLSSTGKSEPPSRDVVRRPEISRYVEGWGRVGDTGFVAHDKKSAVDPDVGAGQRGNVRDHAFRAYIHNVKTRGGLHQQQRGDCLRFPEGFDHGGERDVA